MNAHEQFAEDLTLYALGSLQGEERVALEKHLEGCSTCRRELEFLRGDMALLALSTSGRSPNILAALRAARGRGIVTIGFTGKKGQSMGADCDHLLVAPAEETAIVQQIHLAVAHGICDAVEQALLDGTSER